MRRTNTAKWDEKTKRWKIYVQKDNVRKTFYSSVKGKEGQREANAKADNWLDNNIIDTNLKIKIVEFAIPTCNFSQKINNLTK